MFLLTHLISFIFNFKKDKETKKNIGEMMGIPIMRIFPMHVTIVIGGFFMFSKIGNVIVLVLFLFLKLFLELYMHRLEHHRKEFGKFMIKNMVMPIKENVFSFCFNNKGSIVYLIKLKGDNILIDTSSKENRIELIEKLNQINVKPLEITRILLTHSHLNHIGNIDLFKKAIIHKYDNIDTFPLKEIKYFKVPGHSKDSLAFKYKDVMFSGDTLLEEDKPGRTDLEDSSPIMMKSSLKFLKEQKYIRLCPGHTELKDN